MTLVAEGQHNKDVTVPAAEHDIMRELHIVDLSAGAGDWLCTAKSHSIAFDVLRVTGEKMKWRLVLYLAPFSV